MITYSIYKIDLFYRLNINVLPLFEMITFADLALIVAIRASENGIKNINKEFNDCTQEIEDIDYDLTPIHMSESDPDYYMLPYILEYRQDVLIPKRNDALDYRKGLHLSLIEETVKLSTFRQMFTQRQNVIATIILSYTSYVPKVRVAPYSEFVIRWDYLSSYRTLEECEDDSVFV